MVDALERNGTRASRECWHADSDSGCLASTPLPIPPAKPHIWITQVLPLGLRTPLQVSIPHARQSAAQRGAGGMVLGHEDVHGAAEAQAGPRGAATAADTHSLIQRGAEPHEPCRAPQSEPPALGPALRGGARPPGPVLGEPTTPRPPPRVLTATPGRARPPPTGRAARDAPRGRSGRPRGGRGRAPHARRSVTGTPCRSAHARVAPPRSRGRLPTNRRAACACGACAGPRC